MAARTNKYTSVNFNDIYEQKFSKNNSTNKPNNNSPSSSSSTNVKNKTIISNSRIQGNMLVLTRPTPKPIPIPPPVKIQENPPPDQETISLRPQGRTGTGPALSQPPLLSPGAPAGSGLKSSKFVPPHLRPGFVGKEEKIVGPVVNREIGVGGVNRQGGYGYAENGRPKSGGGYERMMRGGRGGYAGGDVDPSYFMNRPGSSGNQEIGGGAGVHRQGGYGYGENGRPKSGGGYERMMRGGRGGYVGGDVDPSYFMNRHGSSGNQEIGGGAGVHRQGGYGYGENGRPTSGGGYERMMRGRGGGGYVGGDVDRSYFMNRPGSSGNRPNTSG